VITVPPHPFVLEDPSEVPLEDCWIARPQLFFTCFLRPADGRPPKRTIDTYGPDDMRVDLVLFSTFEDLDLPGSGPMEARGVRKYYDPSPTPILYVGPIANMLGRVPLMPLFLHGNSTPTIPHQLRHLQRSKFPYGCTDASDESGTGKGSNVYEVNQWMWEFGRGKPRLGGLSVTETEEWRIAVRTEASRRAQSTRDTRRRKAPKAGAAR
jgi:hypothetical protein